MLILVQSEKFLYEVAFFLFSLAAVVMDNTLFTTFSLLEVIATLVMLTVT